MKNSLVPSNFSPRKILICQLRQIGDVLLATPAIELLAKQYPQAQIYFYTEKKCASLLEHNPYLTDIITLDKNKLKNPFQDFIFYYKVAKKGFDLIVDFQQLPRSRFICLFSKAKIKLTFTPPWYNRLFYTHFLDSFPGYAAYSKLSILRALNIEPKIIKPKLYLKDEELKWADDFLKQNKFDSKNILITLDPTHRRKTRRWPAKYYAKLSQYLCQYLPQSKILLLYGPGEKELVQEIYTTNPRAFIFPSRLLTLREMASLIAKARLHIGNCSAPRHIAVAVNTPSFVILGATGKAWTFPEGNHFDLSLGLSCQPCNQNECEHLRCLTKLSPEQVWQELKEKLSQLGLTQDLSVG
ncbi:MAG: heptosyltransferase [Desulfonauticus sp.]|jgi:ADP-heptose:LPS heptosyltransferase|nr:heptosyltransferase [Desulfonauticus sp.]